MEILILILLAVVLVLIILLFVRLSKLNGDTSDSVVSENFQRIQKDLEGSFSSLRQELNISTGQSMDNLGKMLSRSQTDASQMQKTNIEVMSSAVTVQLRQFEERLKTLETTNEQKLDQMRLTMSQQISKMQEDSAVRLEAVSRTVDSKLQENMQSFGSTLTDTQNQFSKSQKDSMELLNTSMSSQMKLFEERLKTLETTNEQKLEQMRLTMSQQISKMQEDNAVKLDNIRQTVDHKLQKTLDEKMTNSFQLVSQRLEQVHKGLGEMQTLASGVGDLKKILSNVKTRGIMGEMQLGAILSEILTPEQYDTEVSVIPGSRDHVEFAVKLPAADKGEYIYLPIDSKFPGDTYAALQDAYQTGDSDAVKTARKVLETRIKGCAKDIRTKYIAPPYTTNFAVMFLPFEGLYAEVVNMGMVEVLQRDYHVNIAGPSTMAAMLNSLQMGFRTLQIQKHSSEVWKVLGAVKTEFGKFEEALEKTKKNMAAVEKGLDLLVGTRTRQMNVALRQVEQLSENDASALMGSISDEEE